MATQEGEGEMEAEVKLTPEELAAKAQTLYVAYYGRPADPAGLDFWMNEFKNSDHMDNAVRAFGAGPEYETLSKGKTNEELVEALYMQLFGREADKGGLDFYVGKLDDGSFSLASIAVRISDGAVDGEAAKDATILKNRVEVANAFTEAVRADDDVVYNSSQIAPAAALLAAVKVGEGAVAAGEAAVAKLIRQMDGGKEHVLKSGRDIIESGTGDDGYSGTSRTVGATDVIDDASTTDNDVLKITNTDGVASISLINVENVEIIQNMFDGMEGPIDLSKVRAAKVTISSEKLGYDGKAYVSGVSHGTTLVAGAKVTELTAAVVGDSVIDLGMAGKAVLTTSNADKVKVGPTIIVNGKVNLEVKGGASTYTIQGAADAEVELKPTTVPIKVTGTGDITLKLETIPDGVKIENKKSSGSLMVVTNDVDGANISKIDADVVFNKLQQAGGVTITAADGQSIEFAKEQTSKITVKGSKPADKLVVTAASDLGTITFEEAAKATLEISGDKGVTVDFLDIGSVKVDVVSAKADLTVNRVSANAVNFSGVVGKLTIEGISGDSELVGGAGGNTVKLGTLFISTLGYTGGRGTDKIVAMDIGDGARVAATLGAGDDSIDLKDIHEDARIAVDGGAGNDVLILVTNDDNGISTSNWTNLHLTNFETLAFAGERDEDDLSTKDRDERKETLQADVSLKQLTAFKSVVLADAEAGGFDTVNVRVGSEAERIDLSRLTIADKDKVTFDIISADTKKAVTIVGSSVGDKITANDSVGDTITGGGGADTFVFGSGGSYAVATKAVPVKFDTIMDFSTAQEDKINLGVTTPLANVDETEFVSKDALGVFTDALHGVLYKVKDGVLSLEGSAREKALADTLDEWILLVKDVVKSTGVVAFVFDRDTYLVEVNVPGSGDGSSIENLIKLEGVTGVTLTDWTNPGETVVPEGTILLV